MKLIIRNRMDPRDKWFERRECRRKRAAAILRHRPGYGRGCGIVRPRERQSRSQGGAFQEMPARCIRTGIQSWIVHGRKEVYLSVPSLLNAAPTPHKKSTYTD